MTTHTPGPWHYHKSINAHDQGLIVSEVTGANVAVVYDGEKDTTMLAAAPDMYSALEAALEELETLSGAIIKDAYSGEFVSPDPIVIQNARAAITKAKGE